ncbi:MAG: DUF1015 domain-containing protein [Candidatus Aminicenantales bacterium]
MRTYETIALGIPDILLPRPGTDLRKWAVIACDQYTSEPEYWEKVREFVGEAPSTLHLIYPEVYLGESHPEERILRIRETMQGYLEQGLFVEAEGLVYVERRTGHGTRRGLMVCLDLEHYDFRPGARSLIRATEGTILERIPPRVKIREGAPLEVPHIMVLIDDPENTVIAPLADARDRLTRLYSFDLMMEAGHLSGFRVDDPSLEQSVIKSLEALAEAESFSAKYDLPPETPVLLYAMGDGNHSLATAKTIWEKTKETLEDEKSRRDSPLRYALVELVNLHDEALVFEPIHRVLFGLSDTGAPLEGMKTFYGKTFRYEPLSTAEDMRKAVEDETQTAHRIGAISPEGFGLIEVEEPESNLPVGTLQNFLDSFLEDRRGVRIDYVHGAEPTIQLGAQSGCFGFYLPAMDKHELFRTVILDGALPRKTFSMGEAWEKRFYMEARRL